MKSNEIKNQRNVRSTKRNVVKRTRKISALNDEPISERNDETDETSKDLDKSRVLKKPAKKRPAKKPVLKPSVEVSVNPDGKDATTPKTKNETPVNTMVTDVPKRLLGVSVVYAAKGSERAVFSETAWKLLGTDKSGWTEFVKEPPEVAALKNK